jgi:flagellar hook protein FlgE
MLRSLFSGITGLRSHQTMMDVVGNNIANVNSVGFKSSAVVFGDTLSQLLQGAGAPQAGTGGTNPAQVGLGVRLAGITSNFSQGAAQLTGRSTDLMIQGDGFFMVSSAGQSLFTRAGAFSLDANGRLTAPDGGIVQGWTGVNGAINTNAEPSDIRLPIGTLLPPVSTSRVSLAGNMPSDATVGTVLVSSIKTLDTQGNEQTIVFEFTKDATDAWSMTARHGSNVLSTTSVTFDAAGVLTAPAGGAATYALNGATVNVDLSRMSQFGGANTMAAVGQDGSGMGSLQAFTISPDGTLVGVFSNGLKQPLAQLAVATFNNPPGLEKVGNSMYRSSVNSGEVQLGVAGAGGRGLLAGGMLEMSNVDLAAEFTNLIVSQRGFQANSRIITSSDEILQDLVNLKR